MLRYFYILLFFGLLLNIPIFGSNLPKIISSPDGKIQVQLFLKNDSLFYKAYYNLKVVVDDSNIGINYTGGSFLNNLTVDQVSTASVNETYSLPSGKTDSYRNYYNEVVVTFKSVISTMNVIFRVYNDGFAFRYTSPTVSSLDIAIQKENSFVNIKDFESSWVQKYHIDYSWYYEKRDWNSNFTQHELNTPALVKSGDTYILITEAANYGNYASSKFIANSKTGSYNFEPVGSISTKMPFETPWRVVMLGEMTKIVESVMIENLNPPTESNDISWIEPGRVAWDWGGEDAQNTIGFEISKSYIDLAARMGWEYYNLDDGWDSNRADYSLADIVNYANEKGIKLIVWTHNNRFHNNRQDIYNKLKEWKDLGVAGVKVDFWDGDDQATMQKYDKLMDVTAELQMVVNLHGCTKPSGTRRRWPHLLTTEAVLGGEFYYGDTPQMVHAKHNISVALTRNVIGSMDFTPCDFAKKDGRVQQETSWAQQVAHTIAFESGLQYFLDHPNNYKYHIAESFLKRIPVAWNEIKCLEAEPDKYVTIARRKGADWYVASLANEARELKLNLSFLEAGKSYNAYIYKDGDCKSEIKFEYKSNLGNQNLLTIAIIESGGVTVHLTEQTKLPKPNFQKYEAENAVTYGSKPTDPDKLCSGGKYVTNLGKLNKLKFTNINVDEDGDYALTVFYMSDSETSSYVKINDETSPLYYDFMNTGGETGRFLAIKTIVLPLKKGNNSIEFGNAQGFCPNIDRITLKPLVDKTDVESSLNPINFKNRFDWFLQADGVVLNASFEGKYSVFDLHGKKTQTGQIAKGDNFINNLKSGIYIINLSSGFESYSFKIRL